MLRSWRTVAVSLTFVCALVACSDDSDGSGDTSDDSSVTRTDEVENTSGLTLQERVDAATDALSRGDFSTMLRLLTLTSLGNEVEDRAVTILAPNDDAFSTLSADDLANIIANPTQLDDVLRRHILNGAMSFEELQGETQVMTIGGDQLPVVVTGDTVTIGGALVTELDAELTEGDAGQDLAVFELDQVLLSS